MMKLYKYGNLSLDLMGYLLLDHISPCFFQCCDTMELAATIFFDGAWLRALPGSMPGLLVTGGGGGPVGQSMFQDQNKNFICHSFWLLKCPSRKYEGWSLTNVAEINALSAHFNNVLTMKNMKPLYYAFQESNNISTCKARYLWKIAWWLSFGGWRPDKLCGPRSLRK